MKNRLVIAFRQKQLYLDNDPLQPVIVECNVDGTASYVPGSVPVPDWVKMTEFTEGLDQFKLSWTAQSEDYTDGDSGDKNEFGSNYSKGLTLELKFFKDAFQFIYDWLMTTPCQTLNSVEVLITDQLCQKNFRIFELKLDNVKYRPVEEPCIVSMTLREKDDVIHAFQKTIIEDDWQKWFNKDGTSVKDHPTFSMIVEKKPKFYLAINVVLVYVVGILSVGILIALTEGKKWIRRCLGFTYFSPAPLIRTYIENICSKYGYTFDTIFDDDVANDYRDLCLFFPASATYKNFTGFTSPSTKYIWDNRTVMPFGTFLNQLKKVFNAEWYVTPNSELVFKHRSFFDNQAPLYDFTAPGADELFFLEYTYNGKKKPAYGNYQYLVDPQDTCSNEVKYRYNDIVDYDGPANNPMLEGNVTKTFSFAMTAFHYDGTAEDFIEEGVKLGRLVAIGAILIGLGQIFAATNPITVAVVVGLFALGYGITNNYVNDFFDNEDLKGMVRSSSSEINIPRLLLWDRTTDLNKAKVVSVVDPDSNDYYNLTGNDYYEEHPAHDAPANYFGTTVTKIYNYPMFVEGNFKDNLFDRFHEYDNPLRNPTINQEWTGQVDMCEEWLERLGVFENDSAKIGSVISLENRGGRIIKGRIDEIELDYQNGIINLKGVVLK